MPRNEDKSLRCSFCGKDQEKVGRLIAGPNVYICNECVQLCMGILGEGYLEEEFDGDLPVPDSIPTPKEIHAVLDQYIIGQEKAKMAPGWTGI